MPASLHARAWRALAGEDSTRHAALPVSELLAPLPLACLVLLALNDWVLKPTMPGALTGKLSDLAGLALVPLILTAALDLVLLAAVHLGLRVDPTLRAWKLASALALTAGAFSAAKLSPSVAHTLSAALATLFGHAAIVADPTDLLALPALALAFYQGRLALARVPPGRLAYVQRNPVPTPFVDCAHAGADPDAIATLNRAVTAWLAGGPPAPVDAALARLRT